MPRMKIPRLTESVDPLSRLCPHIVSIDLLRSDPHDDHFGAIEVELSDGRSWFYKPRPGAIDLAAGRLLKVFEDTFNFHIPLLITQIVDCGDHHWSKGVNSNIIDDTEQLKAYCYDLGFSCSLAYFLGAADLHF